MDFDTLIRKRASLKGKLTVFKKYVANVEDVYLNKVISNQTDLLELEQRIDKFQNVINEFESVQGEIDVITENLDVEITERSVFESEYFSILSRSKCILLANNQSSTSSNNGVMSAQNTVRNIHNIKLPVIPMPKFDGNYENWLEFRDTFESLIHKDNTLEDAYKFHYLRGSLTGGARQIIASLEFSSENYKTAWELICNRFNNNRILVQNHLKGLFNVKKVSEPSSHSIRRILDEITKHLRALRTLNEPTDHWDTLIIYLITTKLDNETLREWEENKSNFEKPTLINFNEFLKNRADLLESLEDRHRGKTNKITHEPKSFVVSNASCVFCKSNHHIQECPEFLKLSITDRYNQAKKCRLCLNCLRFGHMLKQCRSMSCKHCKGRHNSLLHNNVGGSVSGEGNQNPQERPESVNLSAVSSLSHATVILATVCIHVRDKYNNIKKARALLDVGSQSSFITAELCNLLDLPQEHVDIKVSGLSEVRSNVNKRVFVNVESRVNKFSAKLSCLVISKITGNIPNVKLDVKSLNVPRHLELADPEFCIPSKVDMLIGADLFWQLICVGQIQLSQGAILQKTRFGWIVAGPVQASVVRSNNIQCNTSQSIDAQLTKFWETEECPAKALLSKEELQCENSFVANTVRNSDGRFIVTLPLKASPEKLGESKLQAEKRFLSLERKLHHNEQLRQMYMGFMREYEALGHMTKVEKIDESPISYYMPHHGVTREDSITTKLRVVFDASAPTSTGVSLNNIQMVGPTIQDDLLSIILRFRQHKYVFSADIAKMYRQVWVKPEQRTLQRILWRENSNDPLSVYELNTVTYGTAAASYLAIRCLFQVGNDYEDVKPEVSRVIKRDFYVDDCLTGTDDLEQSAILCRELTCALKNSGFELRKFCSNHPAVLKYVESENLDKPVTLGNDENAKTLGLFWICKADKLIYKINQNFSKRVTKRTILSEISQIFDPLGLLSPCIIMAKIILQELWSEKLGWDETIPTFLHTKWLQIRNEMSLLNRLQIPRKITCNLPKQIEIHGFCDASSRAYGACIYVKTTNEAGDTHVKLLCAKSKVAPLKTQSIPRLELMGAVLLAKLTEKVQSSLSSPIDKTYYWCDSSVVLAWLKTTPNLLHVFVANRVAAIQETTEGGEWRHVPSTDNPADYISRGTLPRALLSLNTYWHGPVWLQDHENLWPPSIISKQDLPELKQTINTCHAATILEGVVVIENYSNLSKLERVVAYCLRFVNNCKNKENRMTGPLSSKEICQAVIILVKISQRESFASEIACLKRNTPIEKNRLSRLSPFIDENGILRVGGRLSQSHFTYDKKHPILLCSKHHLTKLIFRRQHERLLHAGPQHLLASIRDKFWPLLGRNLARKTVHQCVRCFRTSPTNVNPIMGDLPSTRVKPTPPFYVTGVDYAGPFLIKDRRGRGSKLHKAYISLFVCFSTRAIHLELVSDLTTESFIAAFRRFVSRRGKPFQIYSDNGTNFKGANLELKRLSGFLRANSENVENFLTSEGILWKFIPAYSPHFGGLWEAGVKATKSHLLRIAGNASLTFEHFYTMLVQIEAVLNSRPISPLSSDPADLNPLTPAHFLIGREILSVADPDVRDIPRNRLSHFQQIQQLYQQFWSRWSREYISELQQRSKWLVERGKLNLNDMVVIKEDNQPPLKWALGRVIAIHPGRDGVARVATIKTSAGLIKRGFSKICPLPINAV